MIPLFKRYPTLGASVPCLPLTDLPTPITECAPLARRFGATALHIKRDDQTGTAYGGNKVRKLAFLLARAQAQGAKSTLTFGAVGSNHALATAIYARQVGLQPISMLVPQLNAHSVRRNLLRGYAAGAKLRHFSSRKEVRDGTIEELLAAHKAGTPTPFIIPAGGSSPLGTVGYVNAGLELGEQVAAGLLPEPDRIYVASGTMGTCVGLLIGLQLAGLDTVVMAVRVTSPPFTSLAKARLLYGRTVALLRKAEPDFPAITFPETRFCLRDGYLGPHYGRFTPSGMAAVGTAQSQAGLSLEGTYTGKAFACLLDDGEHDRLRDKQVLFWNTYNSVSQEKCIKTLDGYQLPPPFHRYYEEAVQELDR